jgi:hypothetical protein
VAPPFKFALFDINSTDLSKKKVRTTWKANLCWESLLGWLHSAVSLSLSLAPCVCVHSWARKQERDMLGALIVFSLCPFNCDVTFKITVESEIIVIDF